MRLKSRQIADMPQIDGLRTIAVFAAIFSHYLPETTRYFNYGHAGVQLFFVISGFLITGILMRCRGGFESNSNSGISRYFYFKQFYVRRFLRIFPLYYGVVAILALCGNQYYLSLPYHLTYTSNIYFGVTGRPLPAFHFWSLCVEEQFYVFWPFLIFFVARRNLLKLLVGLILSALFSRVFFLAMGYPEQTMYLLATNLDCLSSGGILALVWREGNPSNATLRNIKTAGWIGSVSLLAILLVSFSFPQLKGFGYLARYVFQNFILAILFINIVFNAAIGYRGSFGRFLRLEPIMYLGRISYGLYIFHPFIFSLSGKIVERLNMPRIGDSMQVCISLIGTVLIASASWRYLEAPINELKKYFSYNTPNSNMHSENNLEVEPGPPPCPLK